MQYLHEAACKFNRPSPSVPRASYPSPTRTLTAFSHRLTKFSSPRALVGSIFLAVGLPRDHASGKEEASICLWTASNGCENVGRNMNPPAASPATLLTGHTAFSPGT